MAVRSATQIASRKQPRQARSNDLVAAVLQAALQVLAQEGAHRFTTTRVAERAGVSVGSLYQYFPNKAAILFRLQCDEWRQTAELLRTILEDTARPPPDRLRSLIHAFVRSECDEAAMRVALNDAAPLYREAPESRAARAAGRRTMKRFIGEALPAAAPAARSLAADLVQTTLNAVAKRFSERRRSAAQIEAYAAALADMLCGYLEAVAGGLGTQPPRPPARAARPQASRSGRASKP